ncbi:two-component system regulatory protein YycI [Priestia abyssalis]|uniref:two-component system regulatory protein YycI n=1 Tax=Priestia abyssalis TaxID=1221450 RepID=UPI0009952023|nr:two-component system regulatory protein YycI [Priestia abyssalis]
MDWSKTKTIFIITFLILDLFLAYQFLEKRDEGQLDMIAEISIEEQLAEEKITYISLPKTPLKESYFNAKSKVFSDEEMKKVKKQNVTRLNEYVLQGTFNEPVSLPDSNVSFRLNQFIKENILYGDSYELWDIDKENKTITFYQHYKGKIIYDNASGSAMLVIHLNDQDEMVSYEQSLLSNVEKMDDSQEILPPIKAIENLFQKNELTSGSKVTKVELGYYTFAPLSSSQVLTPTWHIVVDEKIDYFVNAFEGQIIKKGNS